MMSSQTCFDVYKIRFLEAILNAHKAVNLRLHQSISNILSAADEDLFSAVQKMIEDCYPSAGNVECCFQQVLQCLQ